MKHTLRRIWGNPWLLSISSGILLGFSFPPFPFPFLQFPAFILIFRLITLSHSAREAAYFSYPGFLIWNLIATYWLLLATVPGGIAAILANSALMSFVVMLLFMAQKKLRRAGLIALIHAAFWVGYEYLHHHWDLTWPWLTLGNGWSTLPSLIQYISVTGFWGISFWVMFCSSLLYQGIRKNEKNLRIIAAALILLIPLISFFQLPFVSTGGERTIETVIAQPNFNSYNEPNRLGAAQKAISRLAGLTDSVRTPQTKLILWPENGIHPYLSNRGRPNFVVSQIKNRLKQQARQWNATLVGGAPYFEYYTKNNHPPLPRWAGTTPYLTFNAAAEFRSNHAMKVYKKHNLVPVIERFPFVRYFSAIDFFNWVNWAEIQQFGEGQRANNFTADSVKFPALICYDSVYPGWVRHFVQKGAGIITVITNDGWWGNTSGHIQHFDYARLRAIEFRRWIVQDSNNGTSGVIAPTGSVKKRTPFDERAAFRYRVPVLKSQTFYARFGDWLPVVMLGISLLGIVYMFFIPPETAFN